MIDPEKGDDEKPQELTEEDKKWQQTAKEIEQQGPPVVKPESEAAENEVTPLPTEEYPPYGSPEQDFHKWEQVWGDWLVAEMQRTKIDDPKEYFEYFKKNIKRKLGDQQPTVSFSVEMICGKKKFAKKVEDKKEAGKDAKVEGKDKMSQEELKRLKNDFEKLTDFVKRLGVELKDRDRGGYSELISSANLDRLRGAVGELEKLFDGADISVEKINQSVQKVSTIIDGIGKSRQGSRIKEDPKSLGKVSHFLDGIDGSCTDIVNNLRGVGKEEARGMIQPIKKLQDKTRDAGTFIARKRSAARDLFG